MHDPFCVSCLSYMCVIFWYDLGLFKNSKRFYFALIFCDLCYVLLNSTTQVFAHIPYLGLQPCNMKSLWIIFPNIKLQQLSKIHIPNMEFSSVEAMPFLWKYLGLLPTKPAHDTCILRPQEV